MFNVIDWLAETPFFGFTVLEYYQGQFYLIPRKHYSPFTDEIILNFQDNKRVPIQTPLVAFKDYSAELGLLHKACPMIFYKRYALSAWSEYIEKFSMPIRIGKTNREDIQAREQLFQQLEQLGRAAFGVIDTDDAIQFIETSKNDAYRTFDAIIERCNSEISKLILGQTATTDEKSFVGSANVHERQANSITWQDKHLIQLWINQSILPLANINAHFQWVTTDDLTLEKQWNLHKDMLQLGLPVDLNFISQKYNTPLITQQQETKNPPQNHSNQNATPNFQTPFISSQISPQNLPSNNFYDPDYHGTHPFHQQKIFSENHNYFSYLPKKFFNIFEPKHFDPQYNQYENFYLNDLNVETHSYLKIHPHAHQKDLMSNIEAAKIMMNHQELGILIRRHSKEKNTKNAASIINGFIADLYTPKLENSKNIPKTIKNAMVDKRKSQKIDSIVIKIEEKYLEAYELFEY